MIQLCRSLVRQFLVVTIISVVTWRATNSPCMDGSTHFGLADVSALARPLIVSHHLAQKQSTRSGHLTFPNKVRTASSSIGPVCRRFMSQTIDNDHSSNDEIVDIYHDVVLFGIGDMRVDDHGGLIRAIQLQQQIGDAVSRHNNIHCCFVCTDSVLSNVCGIVSHTIDAVNSIVSAVHELDASLQENNFNPLHCILTSTDDTTDTELDIIKYIQNHIILPSSSTDSVQSIRVRVHVCDLGPIDNDMKYGACGQLQLQQQGYGTTSPLCEYEILPWNSMLRTEPWEQVKGKNYDKFPIFYPSYQSQYCTKNDIPLEPQTVPNVDIATVTEKMSNSISKTNNSIPTAETILDRLKHFLPVDHVTNDTTNTGLYGSHFGGIATDNTVGCVSILQHLRTYCDTCNEDDSTFRQFIQNEDDYRLSLTPKRNMRSLEHAAMLWQLDGGNDNWLDGEVMVRLLLLPLYLGTISPRRIWHTAGRPRQSVLQTTLWNPPPLRTLVEGREWHNLLAARHLFDAQKQASMTQPVDRTVTKVSTLYKYWRYHGLLCRYAQTDFANHDDIPNERVGILLVHGFGASGSQWNKAMMALSNMTTALHQGLAPDLIGFGQSEKPSVSYTSYMWDAQIMDFVKDVAIPRHRWNKFITGGNSIGGYTSMSFAACDAGSDEDVTSSGSSGTGRCTGLVLMNSAGPTKTEYEVELERQADASNSVKSMSVAVATAALKLPSCKPPPRPVARLLGNVLLSYLRPNIQSICRNLYPTNPAAVDDILVQDIERDSLDPGAINVMMAGAKLPLPRTSNELLGARFGGASLDYNGIKESFFHGPVLIAQGVLDPLNNSTDRMNRFHSLREGIDVAPIQAGHCPHDELPTEIAQSIADWKYNLKG